MRGEDPVDPLLLGDELRQLYGSESIEEVPDGIIDRKRRLNRPVELHSRPLVTTDEELETQFLKRLFHDTSTIWRDR